MAAAVSTASTAEAGAATAAATLRRRAAWLLVCVACLALALGGLGEVRSLLSKNRRDCEPKGTAAALAQAYAAEAEDAAPVNHVRFAEHADHARWRRQPHALLKRSLGVFREGEEGGVTAPHKVNELVNYCGHSQRKDVVEDIKEWEDLVRLGIVDAEGQEDGKPEQVAVRSLAAGRAEDGDGEKPAIITFATETGQHELENGDDMGRERQLLLCRLVKYEGALRRKVIIVTSGRYSAGSPWCMHIAAKSGCKDAELQKFLDRKEVLLWFVTQHDSHYRHRKLRILPLGLVSCEWTSKSRYSHAPFAQPVWTWHSSKALRRQEIAPHPDLMNLTDRHRWQYLNYRVHNDRERLETHFLSSLPKRPGLSPALLSKSNAFSWNDATGAEQRYPVDLLSSQFVFSPAGTGEDCFRHWEIVFHGAVAIVPGTWSIRELFKDLPVVFYNDDGSVDPDVSWDFADYVGRAEQGKYNFERLTQRWWNAYVDEEIRKASLQ